MFFNYIKLAWRNLQRKKLFAAINTLGLGIFAVTGLLALLVVLLTVSQPAFKAATENPVKALRNE
jgi:ABC-type antimicrobial peptide transport system permease subunit